jgi:hypothetical protein
MAIKLIVLPVWSALTSGAKNIPTRMAIITTGKLGKVWVHVSI